MNERATQHATFTIERTFEAPLARVFDAWANPEVKVTWFHGPPEWGPSQHELDFRVGGRETTRGGPTGGPVQSFDARYCDIIANRRIIYVYEMKTNDRRTSVSLATVEFKAEGTGTKLVVTEQGVYVEGSEGPVGREAGTRALLDALGNSFTR